MAPGVEHCGGGAAPQPGGVAVQDQRTEGQDQMFQALVEWVERAHAPDRITAAQSLAGNAVRTRPLCAYPAFAKYVGTGNTDDAANFACATQ